MFVLPTLHYTTSVKGTGDASPHQVVQHPLAQPTSIPSIRERCQRGKQAFQVDDKSLRPAPDVGVERWPPSCADHRPRWRGFSRLWRSLRGLATGRGPAIVATIDQGGPPGIPGGPFVTRASVLPCYLVIMGR